MGVSFTLVTHDTRSGVKKNLVNLKTLTERAATSFTYAAAAFVIIFQLINYIIQDLVEIKI